MIIKDSKDDLIYNLIFSNTEYFIIDIADYISDIYQYESFISDIKKILKKSKVKVLSSNVIVDSKTVTWELKVIK
jgi:superfamily II DNA/RNA helicase